MRTQKSDSRENMGNTVFSLPPKQKMRGQVYNVSILRMYLVRLAEFGGKGEL
jgi:hypothetical protein